MIMRVIDEQWNETISPAPQVLATRHATAARTSSSVGGIGASSSCLAFWVYEACGGEYKFRASSRAFKSICSSALSIALRLGDRHGESRDKLTSDTVSQWIGHARLPSPSSSAISGPGAGSVLNSSGSIMTDWFHDVGLPCSIYAICRKFNRSMLHPSSRSYVLGEGISSAD